MSQAATADLVEGPGIDMRNLIWVALALAGWAP